MRVLFIAPLPPPVTGHSLASQVFLDGLAGHEVSVVDLSLGSRNDGTVTKRRLYEVGRALRSVAMQARGADAIYLTISESLAGNLKDLLIYLLCIGRLDRLVIHLHGGSIKRLLFDYRPMLARVNAALYRRIGGVVISGPSHEHIFAGSVPADRIHTVPNFAQDSLFVEPAAIRAKFAELIPVRVLYISGMIEPKGYLDLLAAYENLPREVRGMIQLDFAGRFDSVTERAAFLERIERTPGIAYHGVVGDDAKRELFARAHAFCLPTKMFEGQPISILEAYASGCVVLTTGQPGIRDVFTPDRNGFQFDPGAVPGIEAALTRLVRERSAAEPIALANREAAESRFRTTRYNGALTRILAGVAT